MTSEYGVNLPSISPYEIIFYRPEASTQFAGDVAVKIVDEKRPPLSRTLGAINGRYRDRKITAVRLIVAGIAVRDRERSDDGRGVGCRDLKSHRSPAGEVSPDICM